MAPSAGLGEKLWRVVHSGSQPAADALLPLRRLDLHLPIRGTPHTASRVVCLVDHACNVDEVMIPNRNWSLEVSSLELLAYLFPGNLLRSVAASSYLLSRCIHAV